MEHSKPNLDTSNFQIPGSSYSVFIPSELPDLGNWFGSYRYDSPVNISDSFRNEIDTRKSQREKEEGDSFGFRTNGTKVEVLVHKKHNSYKVVKCGSFSRNQCLDKVSGSSELTSSLSEPTDIKNWFSSYVYESPLLDTTDGVGDYLSKERKYKKDKAVKCDSSWRCTKQATLPVSEVPGPSVSPSLLSEPTDIRNWYSSYVYESPSLDTIDGFGETVSKESKCQKGRIMIEDIKRDNDQDFGNSSEERIVSEDVVIEKELLNGLSNHDSSRRDSMQEMQSVSKVPGPLSSSLLSEPTDIRNWFSSYVYESPSLDTADGFGDFICKVSKYEKGEDFVENSDRHKEQADVEEFSKSRKDSEEVDVGTVQSEEPANYNTSCRRSKQERQPGGLNTGVDEDLSGENDLCLEYMQNRSISQAKEDDTSSFNKGGSKRKLHQDTFRGNRFKSSANQRSSCSNDGDCLRNLTQSRGSTLQGSIEATVHVEDNLLLKSDSESVPVPGASVAKSTHGSKEREYDGNGISENGFITTRKRKFTGKNNENSQRGHQENSKTLVDGKEVVAKRKALADTTNFHHSTPTLITGKWQCPQKRKPNLGPPLKQLGLEQWIWKL